MIERNVLVNWSNYHKCCKQKHTNTDESDVCIYVW